MKKNESVLDDILTPQLYVNYKFDGCDDEWIAFDLHVNLTTLERWKTRHGVNRQLVNRERYKFIKEQMGLGRTAKEVAIDLHITTRNVYHILKQYEEVTV